MAAPRIAKHFRHLACGVALGLALFFAFPKASAHGSGAQQAVDVANAALDKATPSLTEARAAAEQAVAAADDANAVSEALFVLGRLDEGNGGYTGALEHYRAGAAVSPESRWASQAKSRAAWLRARSEGDFAPLAVLERVRRDPALSDDPQALAALARQADGFPPGLVRVEARMLVGEAWLGRLHRPEDALAELRAVASDPDADPLTARLAEREIVDTYIARGALRQAAREASAHANWLDPRFANQVRRLVRRQTIFYGAAGEVILFFILCGGAIARAARQRMLPSIGASLSALGPLAIGFAAYVAVVGGILASRYESGNAAPFLGLGVVIVPLVFAARAWGAVGSREPAARAFRALLSGASVVAAAFILLDVVNPTYLDGFGL